MSKTEWGILVFFMFLMIILYMKCNVEQFSTMNVNDTNDFYPLKGIQILNPNNALDVQQHNLPQPKTRRVGNFRQQTNNRRKWVEPDNGSCTPSDVCNILYEGIEQKDEIAATPPDYFNQNRINFYTYEV